MKFIFALLLTLMAGPVFAAAAPIYPLPPSPTWCTNPPIAVGQIKGVTLGPCPAPPIQSCPAGRITSTVLSLRYDGFGRKVMDVTSADNVFGYYEWNSPILQFPWKQGFTIFWGLPRTPGTYVAMKFKVPANTPMTTYGRIYKGETSGGPPGDFAISPSCGDFSPQAQYCFRENILTGGLYGSYKAPGSAVVAACTLVPGQEYYLNLRITNPSLNHFDCTNTTCKMTIQNNHSN